MSNFSKAVVTIMVMLALGCIGVAGFFAFSIPQPEADPTGYYALHLVNPFVLIQTTLCLFFGIYLMCVESVLKNSDKTAEYSFWTIVIAGCLGLISTGVVWGFQGVHAGFGNFLALIYDVFVGFLVVFSLVWLFYGSIDYVNKSKKEQEKAKRTGTTTIASISSDGELNQILVDPAVVPRDKLEKIKQILKE